MSSAAGRPTVGRTLPRARVWSVVLCLTLVSGLLLLPATSASAASFVVTSAADAGPGTLRQAVLDTNASPGNDVITFAIPGTSQTISPLTPLPAITEGVTIDGLSQPGSSSCATWPPTLMLRLEGSGAGTGAAGFTVTGGTGTVIDGFVIRRFPGDGIAVDAPAAATQITCNAIGTNAPGTAIQGNDGAGIAVRGTGTDPSTIDTNIIMNNTGPGVLVGGAAQLVSIRGNRIFANGGLGIEGNGLQGMPDVSAATTDAIGTTVTGSLTTSSPAVAGQFVIEFFVSPACDTVPAPGGFGEGATPIGSVTIPAAPSGPGALPFTASSLGATSVGDIITATATDGSGSGNTSELSACVPVVQGTGGSSADLSVSGTVSPDPLAGDGAVTYALTVHNDGPDDATDVQLINVLPSGINFDGADPSTGSCNAVVLTVTCDLGAIGVGAANDVTVAVHGTAQDVGGQIPLSDQVSVGGSSDDPDPIGNQTTIDSTLRARQVDLVVTKSGPASVITGQTFHYTIGVKNTGPDPAHSVVMTDTLPGGVTFAGTTPSQGTCGQAGGIVTCDVGSLGAGANATIDVQVLAAALPGNDPVTVKNSASAVSDRGDLNPDDNTSAPVSTTIQPNAGADLTVTSVSNTPNPVTGGYDIGYTASVKNLGPGGATNVALTDALANGESFVAVGSDPRCSATAALVTCALGAMANGATTTVLIVTKTPTVGSATTIHDGFAVSAPEDGTHGNDALDVATSVRPRRTDWAAGYVPMSPGTTWLSDATQWVHGDAVATMADPSVAFVGIPGGGPGGPVTITETPCGAPFACVVRRSVNGTSYPAQHGVFSSLVTITVPTGYGTSNPVVGVFLDNWSLIPFGWDPFKVAYQDRATGAVTGQLPWCGGWSHTGPPCVADLQRIHSWWNPYANWDLRSVVRFAGSATFGRAR